MKLTPTSLIITGLVLFLVIFLLLKAYKNRQFIGTVRKLYALSEQVASYETDFTKLNQLPAPVQRYFRHVLKENQAPISYVRLKHDGYFKSGADKEWAPIEGEQHFTVQTPGFIWRGKTKLFTAVDQYVNKQGSLKVSLWNVLPIVNAQGKNYNESELQRWLAESFWFPTLLLNDERIHWSVVDDSTARLHFNYQEHQLQYLVRFNEKDEIEQLETERYMDKNTKKRWLGIASEYEWKAGIRIPTKIEAAWELDTGRFSYAKFKIKEIEFNRPEIYY